MALLQLLSEEEIADEREFADVLYRVVCVGERPALDDRPASLVRSTYLVDWEQLVHLLEEYQLLGEDIVEVAAIRGEHARVFRPSRLAAGGIARA